MSSKTGAEYGVRYYDGTILEVGPIRDYARDRVRDDVLRLLEMGVPAVYHPQMVSRKKTTTYGEWERVLDADTSA